MITLDKIRNQLSTDKYDRRLMEIYCCASAEQTKARILAVCAGFESTFGANQAIEIFSAPGRTELGGNHTDHQHGHVLAASVDMDFLACAAPNDLGRIRLQSEGYPMEEIDLAVRTPQENERNSSSALIRGIAARIHDMGYPIAGFDAYVTSSVLPGSGLSSSAAYEVLIGVIINRLCCRGELTAVQIARISQLAENIFFGKPCGLMDQMASSVGGIISIDFNDPDAPEITQVPFEFSTVFHALCIIDSGADHANLTDEYASVPAEMGAVAQFFGKSVLREVDGAQVYQQLPALRAAVGDRAVLRAIHFFEDDRRATDEARALSDGDFSAFLRLITASGESSFMHLQNVYTTEDPRQQAVAVALAVIKEALGGAGAYRMQGGGFAGTVQAFVPREKLKDFTEYVNERLGENACHVMAIRPVGGIVLINE